MGDWLTRAECRTTKGSWPLRPARSLPGSAPGPTVGGVSEVSRAVALFALAGLAEIGGGYLVWRWVRDGAAWWVALIGGVVLIAYGVIPTLQREDSFGRVYAAYGGVFVVLSLLWGWWLDGRRPDRWDVIGAVIVSVGVAVIFFTPRSDG